MIVKILGERRGDHIHARLFMGEMEGSLGLCGELVFRIGEWQLFGAALGLGAQQTGGHLAAIFSDPLQAEEEALLRRIAAERLLA